MMIHANACHLSLSDVGKRTGFKCGEIHTQQKGEPGASEIQG
jgi:hypothetical protein